VKNLIKSHATAELNGNVLSIRGTDINEWGDILADALMLIPTETKFGLVSWSVHQQAKEIFLRYYNRIDVTDHISINGHSLGAGIALHLAILLRSNWYKGKIEIHGVGGLKSVGRKAMQLLNSDVDTTITWRVRYKDPVPYIDWWASPKKFMQGEKRKHIFDWDFKEHMAYWG